MIAFEVVHRGFMPKEIPDSYPALLEYEAKFRIVIDGQVFFEEPDFPIYEFLHFANDWKEQDNRNFEYVSMETEDNPLISFICEGDLWTIHSPWQLFECTRQFAKEEIVRALEQMIL